MHRTIFLALAALAPGMALADDLTWYGGIGVGGMRLEQDTDIVVSAYEYQGGQLTLITSRDFGKLEGTDAAFRAFGGVRLGPYLAVELGYINLGEPEDNADLLIPPVAGTRPETDVSIKAIAEIDGFDVYALGAIPFAERWEAFAKLGLIRWDSTVKIKNVFADTFPPSGPPDGQEIPTVTPPSSNIDDDGVDLAGGVGLTYKATERMSLRGEGTWYDIDDTDQLWMIGMNVIIDF